MLNHYNKPFTLPKKQLSLTSKIVNLGALAAAPGAPARHPRPSAPRAGSGLWTPHPPPGPTMLTAVHDTCTPPFPAVPEGTADAAGTEWKKQ